MGTAASTNNSTAGEAIDLDRIEEVNSRTFVYQTDNGTIFFRHGKTLWIRRDDQKVKATLKGGSDFSIMAAQGEAIYYGSNYKRQIYKAHLTATSEIQINFFRQMLEDENLHPGGMCSIVRGDKVHIHKMSDELKNSELHEPMNVDQVFLETQDLQGLHGNSAIFRQLVFDDIQPEVKLIRKNVISLVCFRGVKARFRERTVNVDLREFNAPWSSPAVVKSDYVYMTNGNSLFVIDPIRKKLLPPLIFSDVSSLHIAGIHNGIFTGRGKCDKSGKYYLMSAQLPSEYVDKPLEPVEQHPKEETFSSEFRKKFNVKSIIGKGGSGCVFKVVDVHDNCEYAVKRIAARPVRKEGALKEGKVLAKLKHPGIVSYNGMWVEEPPEGWQHDMDAALIKKLNSKKRLGNFNSDSIFIYIKLQLCDHSLHDWLNDNPDQSSRTSDDEIVVLPNIKQWFKEMVSAVKYLHEKNLIHRDLKPSNILFADDDSENKKVVKICDLGIAAMRKDEGDSMKTAEHRTFVGTFAYMSPEQLNSLPYGSSTDVFALGLILAEMCLAMSNAERDDIFTNYRLGQQCDRIVNANAKGLIEWLTQKNPEDRPTCSAMQNHVFIA